uniref:carbohydrate sulfotransferase 11-like n=1 Tax=Styela clava TaxID=7725 RepID=UPI00193A8AB0|nr:carbohydrate sulfotransferase 11-like [Styela clava]
MKILFDVMPSKVKQVKRRHRSIRSLCIFALLICSTKLFMSYNIFPTFHLMNRFVKNRKTISSNQILEFGDTQETTWNSEETRYQTNEKYFSLGNESQQSKITQNNKVVVEKLDDGRNTFHIEGLPTAKIREVRHFLSITKPPENMKHELTTQAKQVYQKRKERLLETCEDHLKQEWSDDMQLISSPDQILTVCVVQKAGSSSWHKVVYNLRNPNTTWSGIGHGINREHGMSLPEIVKYDLMNNENGTRVLTVRHPFSRIISGWNNKFHKNHLQSSTRILSELRGIEKYINLSKADDDHIIAFEDFVQYLVDRGLKGIDAHFRTVEQLCRPCNFPYDYISKTETSLHHLWYILERVGGNMTNFAKHYAVKDGFIKGKREHFDMWKAEQKIISNFFEKVPVTTTEKLFDLYKIDFHRFGYTFDIESRIAGDNLG